MSTTHRGLVLAAFLLVAAALAASAFAALAPTITSFTPTSAKPKASITITGTNLKGAKTVKVDGMSAKFKVDSATKVVATLPTKAKSGKIVVTTAGGKATSSDSIKVS